MTRKSDEHLQNQVEQKLLAHGIRPPCRVTVVVRNGVVTVSGTVQHDYQRSAVVHACRAMTGVKRIVNNVQAPGFHNVWKSTKEWEQAKPKVEPTPSEALEKAGETRTPTETEVPADSGKNSPQV